MQQNQPPSLPTLAPARMQMSAGTNVNALQTIPAVNQQVYHVPDSVSLAPLQQQQVPVSLATLPANSMPAQSTVCHVSMNAIVEEEVILTIKLPWEVFDKRFDYVFIGRNGEVVVAVEPALFNETTDNWHVTGETIVFGSVGFNQHWRKSLTIRPDTDCDAYEPATVESPRCTTDNIPVQTIAAQLVEAAVPFPTAVAEPKAPDVITAKIDTGRMSRGQFKRHTAAMAQKGLRADGTPLV